jgi:cytochrome c biogenesis protein
MRMAEGSPVPLGSELYKMQASEKTGSSYEPKTDTEIELVKYENLYREKQFHKIDPESGFPTGYFGMPSSFVSYLKIITGADASEKTIKEKTVEVNHPLSYQGVTYYQYGVDADLKFTIETPGQTPVTVETSLTRPKPIAFPTLGIECYVTQGDYVDGTWESVNGTRTELPAVIRLLDRTQSGTMKEPVLVGYVSKNKPLAVEGFVVHLDDVKKYTVLQYVHDPGVPLVGLGGLLLAIGMTIALYFPYRTVRVMLQAKGQGTTYIIGSNSRGATDELIESLKKK